MVEKGLAGIRRDHDPYLAREDPGAARDGAPVPLCLPYDGGRLAGDGRLIDEGHPFDDLPVPRHRVPVLYEHNVALPEREGRRPSRSARRPLPLRPYASVCAFLSVSAWALPLPSARASAKVAKSTVNQSHRVICRLNQKGPPETRLLTAMTVVTTETISTTNMTGFRHRSRGSSLLKAPATADLMSPALPDGYASSLPWRPP